MQKILLLAVAGGLGALARYGLSGLVHRWTGTGFPWGTAAVNIAGCFFFGLIWSLLEGRFALSSQARVIVLTGFMGAFTTFSTYMFETAGLVREAQWGLAALNLMLQNGLGFLGLWWGFTLGRAI